MLQPIDLFEVIIIIMMIIIPHMKFSSPDDDNGTDSHGHLSRFRPVGRHSDRIKGDTSKTHWLMMIMISDDDGGDFSWKQLQKQECFPMCVFNTRTIIKDGSNLKMGRLIIHRIEHSPHKSHQWNPPKCDMSSISNDLAVKKMHDWNE